MIIKIKCDRCDFTTEAKSLEETQGLGFHTILITPFMAPDKPYTIVGDICQTCTNDITQAINNPTYKFTFTTPPTNAQTED